MKRRSFVGGVIAGLATSNTAASGARLQPGDIPKRTFGKTGEKLTIVGHAVDPPADASR